MVAQRAISFVGSWALSKVEWKAQQLVDEKADSWVELTARGMAADLVGKKAVRGGRQSGDKIVDLMAVNSVARTVESWVALGAETLVGWKDSDVSEQKAAKKVYRMVKYSAG